MPDRFVVAAGDELPPGGSVVDVGHGRNVVHVHVEGSLQSSGNVVNMNYTGNRQYIYTRDRL